MSRRLQENIVAGVLLAAFVGYLLMTLGFGPNARLVPVPIAALGTALLVIHRLREPLFAPNGRPSYLFGSHAEAPTSPVPASPQ
ncbi:MAG: hypothetical protein OXF98_10970, partial [Rhodospirillaceae bacterium]|nr:hypothetical protein [Rhodospirillaceae bacterium]